MTAMLGYTNRKEGQSIGVLAADDLVGWCNSKADKLTKINDRFVIGVVGLEAVNWALHYTTEYFSQFSGSRININNINELEAHFTDSFEYCFRRWREENFYNNISEQESVISLLVVLDTIDNSLYYSNIGRVWLIDDDYEIKFEKLQDGKLYAFGAVAPGADYIEELYTDFDQASIIKFLCKRMRKYMIDTRGIIGDLGSMEINVLGEEAKESFSSGFNSFRNFIDVHIERTLQERMKQK